MRKLLLALGLIGISSVCHAKIDLIDEIAPKNGAFRTLINSTYTYVSTAAFSGNLAGVTPYAQDVFNKIDQLNLGSSTGSYILNQNTLQSGATFYVSSGTVNKQFSYGSLYTSSSSIGGGCVVSPVFGAYRNELKTDWNTGSDCVSPYANQYVTDKLLMAIPESSFRRISAESVATGNKSYLELGARAYQDGGFSHYYSPPEYASLCANNDCFKINSASVSITRGSFGYLDIDDTSSSLCSNGNCVSLNASGISFPPIPSLSVGSLSTTGNIASQGINASTITLV